MELGKLATGVATWTHEGMEIWRRPVGVQTWRHGGMELRGARYRCSNMDV